MADEIIPNKETPIIEPITEPTQAPEAISEPVTAQIPPNEPLTPEPEPISEQIKTPPEELPVSTTLPKEIPPASEPKPVAQSETIVVPVAVANINLIRELLNKAQFAIQTRKKKKMEKIMTLFAKWTKITNDEVEKFLHVSDSTATRYLEILEKENKIKQVGKTGKAVSYSKI